MLTFNSQTHSSLYEAYHFEGINDSQPLGQPDTLTLLFVQQGGCTLSGRWPVEAGCLAAFAGIYEISPLQSCTIIGACLGGNAPAEAAAALSAPLIWQAGQHSGAIDILRHLQEGVDRLTDAEKSAMSFTLLCRLSQGETGRGLSPLVAAAVAQMREHHGEVYGVEELAGGLEVSKSHLIRRFTAEVGTSPGQYLTQVRVEAAKRLLLRGDYPLEVIAGLCGFSGANYLCKVFKKETGETPAAWRKRAAPAASENINVLDEQMYL